MQGNIGGDSAPKIGHKNLIPTNRVIRQLKSMKKILAIIQVVMVPIKGGSNCIFRGKPT